MFHKFENSIQIMPLNFTNASVLRCVSSSLSVIVSENLGLFDYLPVTRNLDLNIT